MKCERGGIRREIAVYVERRLTVSSLTCLFLSRDHYFELKKRCHALEMTRKDIFFFGKIKFAEGRECLLL